MAQPGIIPEYQPGCHWSMASSAVIWIVVLLAVALAVPLGLFLVLRVPKSVRDGDDLPAQWPLVARPVFSSAERRLYRQLADALPRHVILAKLPLVRLCQPSEAEPERVRYWFRLLGGTHVAFAICDPHGRVLAAVDLVNDRSRTNARTQRIKAAVLHACKVRYLTCTEEALPTHPALRALVPQVSPEADQAQAGNGQRTIRAPHRAAPALNSEFDDSFFRPPGDSVLGEFAAGSAAEAPRAPH